MKLAEYLYYRPGFCSYPTDEEIVFITDKHITDLGVELNTKHVQIAQGLGNTKDVVQLLGVGATCNREYLHTHLKAVMVKNKMYGIRGCNIYKQGIAKNGDRACVYNMILEELIDARRVKKNIDSRAKTKA